MKIFSLLFLMLIFTSFSVIAHEDDDSHYFDPLIFAALENAQVKIYDDGDYRYIQSNGLPNHETGAFPNRSNPNSISSQSHRYRMPLSPLRSDAKEKGGIIGVAINGIPFEPATAECYGFSRGQRPSPDNPCSWREEAIKDGRGLLGLDSSNAHVQPNGTYHYHGIPYGLMKRINASADLVHVGYAADGFALMVSRSNKYKPSYMLKSGMRSSGPGGKYDGTYSQDFSYIEGSGELDRCNGMIHQGQYIYLVTQEFPFAPRCLMGEADQSFERKGSSSASSSRGMRGSDNHQGQRRHPPPHHRRGF